MQRKQTEQVTKRLVGEAAAARARVRLKAWEALEQQLNRLDTLPPREQRAILALALKYTDSQPLPDVPADPAQEPGVAEQFVRQRLQMLAAGLPPTAIIEQTRRAQLDAGDDGIVDAVLVEPPRQVS